MLKVLPLSGCRAVELKDKDVVLREPAVGSEGRPLGAKLAQGAGQRQDRAINRGRHLKPSIRWERLRDRVLQVVVQRETPWDAEANGQTD